MKTNTSTVLISASALALSMISSHAATVYQDAVLAHNPLLYWTFDEAGDTDVASSLVNNTVDNQLSPQGGASRTASTTTTGGVSLGRAASFDGVANTMFSASDLFGDPTPGGNNDSPGFDFITSQLWAVEFWFNVADAPSQYFSETFDGGGNSNNPSLIYNFNSGQLELFGEGGRTGPTGITAGTWHHAVAAFYGNNNSFADNLREFYVDGVLFQSTSDAFSSGHGLRNIAIGNATNGSNPVTGAIDEYAIYELGGLSDLAARQAHVAEIAGHYNLVPEPSAGLLVGLGLLGFLRRRR